MAEKKFSIDLDAVQLKEKQSLTHGIHPYPAKYIPQIPAALLDYLSLPAGSIVLDPFCGSGTTLLEANIRGLDAVGIDSNPIAALISRTKCTPLNEERRRIIEEVASTAGQYFSGQDNPGEIPDFLNRDHWFQKNMLRELGYINYVVHTVEDPVCRDFLSTAFSAIIVKTSNQESDTRWRAKKKNLPHGYAIEEFQRKIFLMLRGFDELSAYKLGSTTVYTRDARDLDILPDEGMACVITSPPYMNSYDYYLYHKLRMFWLGYDHRTVQKEEIGSRNKHCDKKSGVSDYEESMGEVLGQVYRKLKPGGFCCIVIGDSILKGNLIRMDQEYEQTMRSCGFALEEVFSFNQRKYTKAFTPNIQTAEKQSHIMIFQKN